jgi:YidC/Oxa1 family membrane protein insertase
LERKTKTRLLGGFGLLLGAVVLSGCTTNFCTNLDKANIAYSFEQGVTIYCDKDQVPAAYADKAWKVFDSNDNLYAYIPVDENGDYSAQKAIMLTTTIQSARTSNINIPSQEYFKAMDQRVLEEAIQESNRMGVTVNASTITAAQINPFVDPTADEGTQNDTSLLRTYGYVKFYGYDDNGSGVLWYNWMQWTNDFKNSSAYGLGTANCPDDDFTNLYETTVNNKISKVRSCIATQDGRFGHYGVQSNWEVAIEKKDWGYAWSKGFLEGLIVYPVASLVDTFSYSMDPALSGWGQIWAIIFVTLIVRFVVLALTFKSTLDQQKMQALQPEIAKIQAKYPNSNEDKAQQSRMTAETMALYKRNKTNPASTFIALIVQFPVFIAVWGALEGSSALATGEALNLRLSDTIQSVLFDNTGLWYLNSNGWWTALILFLLMMASQWLAMMLPQWITKARTKKMPKLTKNPAEDKNAKTMKWFSYGMIIFMGVTSFILPAAMGVYWLIGAIISMIQTVITQAIMGKKKKEKRI